MPHPTPLCAPLALDAAQAALPAWLNALEQRHLAELRFAEVRRGAQALQRAYWRGQLADGSALQGRGKQAAFALVYAPLHFVLTAHIVCEQALGPTEHIVDLGCGSGVAGAAWALCHPQKRPSLTGVDINAWALSEARWNWRQLGVQGRVHKTSMASASWPLPARAGVVCAFSLNELPPDARQACLTRLLRAHESQGAALLLIEPLAKTVTPFWGALAARIEALGGRQQEHRLPAELPPRLALLRRSLSRSPLALGARSLALPARGLSAALAAR